MRPIKIPCEIIDRSLAAYMGKGRIEDALQIVAQWMRSQIAFRVLDCPCYNHSAQQCQDCSAAIVEMIREVGS